MSPVAPASSPLGPRSAPRWSMAGTATPTIDGGARVDGRAAGEQGEGLGGPAVGLQRAGKPRIGDADQVAGVAARRSGRRRRRFRSGCNALFGTRLPPPETEMSLAGANWPVPVVFWATIVL